MADFGESIYNLVPRPVEVPPKEPRYRSQHSGKINPADFELGSRTVKPMGTFGPAQGALRPDPHSFTKKHEKEPKLGEPTLTHPKPKVKPPIPKDEPVYGLVSSKNFITANAVENILSSTKVKEEPKRMIDKKDYGQVPKYLTKVKQQVAQEQAQIEEFHQRMANANNPQKDTVTRMSEEERQELIRGLKDKWQKINEAYQRLPMTLDTPAKKKRKEEYEAQLIQIDKDIELLSRRVVLVAGDY
eukprot:jgi/Mesvir1/24996/Mv16953-RA.1